MRVGTLPVVDSIESLSPDTDEAPGSEGPRNSVPVLGMTDGVDDGTLSDVKTGRQRRFAWSRPLAFGLLPALAMLLTMGAGVLKWQDHVERSAEVAAVQSVQAARDSTVALLSYRPDTVDTDLGAARSRLTGEFLDSYTALTDDVVIPGAKQKRISAVATVPAGASVAASESRAVVMLFVNQSTTVGNDAPTQTASTVKATLEKVGGRWLISGFEPV